MISTHVAIDGSLCIFADDDYYSTTLPVDESVKLAREVLSKASPSELEDIMGKATSGAQEAPELTPDQDELACNALLQYSELCKRVSALPHLMRPAKGDPYVALMNVLNLLDTPNNVDALWVWSAFAAAFGQGNTWEAERALNTLLNWTATHAKLIGDIASDADIESLKKALADAATHCFTMLEHVLANFRKWPDLAQFVAFKKSQVQEPEATEVKS